MFMAAVARPRWIQYKQTWFDGLIGIWPYVKQKSAKRNSRRRQTGTLVTKNFDSINSEEHQQMILTVSDVMDQLLLLHNVFLTHEFTSYREQTGQLFWMKINFW
jgi:hypothetical protein